jgi:3-oxoacyl-[acyl-carrier protein] reductase
LPLHEKLAVVSGASGGIGSQVARRFARDGASVLVHYNASREAADAVVADIHAAGSQAEAFGADLGHLDGLQL